VEDSLSDAFESRKATRPARASPSGMTDGASRKEGGWRLLHSMRGREGKPTRAHISTHVVAWGTKASDSTAKREKRFAPLSEKRTPHRETGNMEGSPPARGPCARDG